MNSILLGAVADDDTGATDLAGMLRQQGLRTIVVFDSCSAGQLAQWSAQADAVILATASRSVSRQDAHERTRKAIRLLQSLRPRIIFVKYCSTFDSTPEGNIGASIEAALEVCGESFTIAVPALPAMGRTTYQGHHFVGRQLLSESSMRDHPLNPMRNSDLVSHLSTQTRLAVGLAPYPSVLAGSASLHGVLADLRKRGIAMAVVDCVTQEDLQTIAHASSDIPLLTGSSALGMVLPDELRRQGLWTPGKKPLPEPARSCNGRGFLIVAGSCSVATRAQNHHVIDGVAIAFPLDPVHLGRGTVQMHEFVNEIVGHLQDGNTCLIETTSAREDAVRQWQAEDGLDNIEAGERISSGLATLVQHILDRSRPEGLIIAGGETSSSICRALRLGAIDVGPQIEPGVPVCVSLAEPRLPLVLKSGNFGSVDFYTRAIEAIHRLPLSNSPPQFGNQS